MATTLTKTIRVQVRGGVFEPLERVDLPEGQPLNVTITTINTVLPKKKYRLGVWHLGALKGRLTRDEIYGELI
ncbi:antitoxin family protein [Candidatus Uhrbacteria bacterium]|nr:antitoxin family protein [Candidatus Uhrbacteria bacterium]